MTWWPNTIGAGSVAPITATVRSSASGNVPSAARMARLKIGTTGSSERKGLAMVHPPTPEDKAIDLADFYDARIGGSIARAAIRRALAAEAMSRDLLAACETVVRQFGAGNRIEQVIQQITDAIAKAKGEVKP